MKTATIKKNSIELVTENLLCCGCGGCAAVCKHGAISMKENPAGYLVADINDSCCMNCGVCLKVCPSYSGNQKIESYADVHGEYVEAFAGYAIDPEIRNLSQSGGVVTALLVYLLEKGKIQGAYVNAFDSQTNRPKVIYAQTRKQLINSAGSYYSQSSVAKAVLEHVGGDCATVVLGCQAESLEVAGKHFQSATRPKYVIGLLCAGQNSGRNIDYLIKKSGCTKSPIEKFRYKSKDVGGWPGNVLVYAGGKSFTVSKDVRLLSKDIFGMYRCNLCYDKANIYSDIVCGDPWGLSEFENSKGNTIILVRNNRGKEIITNAVQDDVLHLTPLDTKKFFQSACLQNVAFDAFCKNSSYISEQGYPLPYEVTEDLLHMGEPVNVDVQKKMDFRRCFYCCDSSKRIEEMIHKKDKEIANKLFAMKKKRYARLLHRIADKLRGD